MFFLLLFPESTGYPLASCESLRPAMFHVKRCALSASWPSLLYGGMPDERLSMARPMPRRFT